MTHSSPEPLEPRIAPATLLSPTSFTYIDVDGDNVRVTFSKPILTADNFDTIVNISGGLAGTGAQDLIGLDLFGLGPSARGLNVTITATPSPISGGDSLIAGVYIDAFDYDDVTDVITGVDLGVVKIDGDLTYIDTGDPDGSTVSIRSLVVKSVGLTEPGTLSEFWGPAGTIRVTGNFAGDFFAEGESLVLPDFKNIAVTGSILGNLGPDAGRIYATGGIGPVTVGGNLIGGTTDESGSIRSANSIAKVTIGGSLIGGDGLASGRLRAFSFGSILVKGSIVGGYGHGSAAIETFGGNIGPITVFGSIIGGLGDNTASIQAGDAFDSPATLKSLVVKGSVIGIVPESGNTSLGVTIRADNSIGRVTITGALLNANIAAGVQPGVDNAYGTDDDLLTAGFPDALRRLGPVSVLGGVNASIIGFGIAASSIASIKAGGPLLKPGSPFVDFDTGFLLGGGAGLRVMQIP